MEKPIIGITSSIKEDGTHMISKDNIRSIVDHGGYRSFCRMLRSTGRQH
ncbi:hypothetical protein [Geomicrobium sp. JCM 19037]|nr:hypothetical protein [Geomicrobium sp. JCM 19037]